MTHGITSTCFPTPSTLHLPLSLIKACRHRVKSLNKHQCSCIRSSSGPACTHSLLNETATSKVGRVAHRDQFVCSGAVDTAKLLHLSRRELYSIAQDRGGNVLMDEQWSCKISQPKFRRRDRFTVSIEYSATVGRSSWPDAQRPVQLKAAKGVGGLMTIIDRAD
ncbi:hypothetical protein JAAARDRAFT_394087 [Jaapia argillacea MUCL 33604]|uniref:Uncharacterized protein n=1 Tax=Jaapia argillacea MUCL 33604 TaxID=933084 RepID=A0A067QK19_9AGAM|nr:hypothetical protein JAAARDRAFT_394087 [Jaapia argillacea MUCL 33604]